MKTRTGTIRSVNLDGDADPAISASASASIGGGAQSLKILGSVSGVITIQGAANAGTYTLTMPTDDGTIAGQALLTDGAGGLSWAGVGTVTTVSVTTANGVSASVANATTTPALTFTLGAITPSTVQGLTITTTTGTFTLTNAKTFSVSNTLTLAGTDGSTLNVGAGGTLGTLAFQSGTFSGTSSGTNTGDQTTIAGNAGSATILQTARTINGTSFNGSTNITVTADASTLSGTTLNYTVLASSLTSVGTLASLAVYSATEIDFWCDANIDLECAGTFIVEAGVAFSAAAQAVSLFTGSTITMSGQPNGTALTLDDSAQTVGITAANGLTLNGGQIAPLSAVLQAIQDEGAVSGPGKINLGNTIDSAVMDGSITMGSDAIITFTVGGTGINFFGASALISNVSGTSGTVLSSNGDGSALTALNSANITASVTNALGIGTIELGHATDTTLARVSAGVMSVEGVTVPTISSTSTLTNKTISGASNTITNVSLTAGVTGTLPRANGGTGATVQPAFAAWCSAATTLPSGAGTKVTFGTEDFDTESNYDTTNSKFVAPIAGKYRFNVTIIVSGGIGSNAEVYFAKNGTKEKSVYFSGNDLAFLHTIGGSAVLSLAANDYIEVFAFNDSGSSRTAHNYQAYTQFAGQLITP